MAELKEIDIDLVDDPVNDIRENVNMQGVEELAISIENTGLINPITVFKNRRRYEVVVGHRRLIACKIAKMDTITAIITEIDPDKLDVMKLDENIFREDVSPVMIAKYIYRIMQEKELTTMEMARYFGKTPQWVNTMIRLLDIDDYTQEAITAGQISYAGALELQKVDNESTRATLTQAAVKGGAHTRVIKNWVNDYRSEIDYQASRTLLPTEKGGVPEEREYKRKCICCNQLKESETIITVEICPECYPIIKAMCKSYREG